LHGQAEVQSAACPRSIITSLSPFYTCVHLVNNHVSLSTRLPPLNFSFSLGRAWNRGYCVPLVYTLCMPVYPCVYLVYTSVKSRPVYTVYDSIYERHYILVVVNKIAFTMPLHLGMFQFPQILIFLFSIHVPAIPALHACSSNNIM
jgi:hypothetical protein